MATRGEAPIEAVPVEEPEGLRLIAAVKTAKAAYEIATRARLACEADLIQKRTEEAKAHDALSAARLALQKATES